MISQKCNCSFVYFFVVFDLEILEKAYSKKKERKKERKEEKGKCLLVFLYKDNDYALERYW